MIPRAKQTLIAGLTGLGLLTGINTGIGDNALAASIPGKRDEVHKRFNGKAKEFGIDNRMVLSECVHITCNYTITGNLAVMASSTSDEPNKLEGLIMIFGKGSDGASMIIAMGILMFIYSPDVGKRERAAGMTSLTKGITSGADKTNVILGSTKYTIANYESMGVWFSVGGR